MRAELMSIGDDYWIEDDQGHKAYRVDGKAIHVRKTFILEDAGGREVAKIQERKLSIRDKMAIERDGDLVAKVSKKLFRIRDSYGVEIRGRQDDALLLAAIVAIEAMAKDE